MKVLFIGGTGIISSACTALAAEKGMQVTLLNRGKSDRRIPEEVEVVHADIDDRNVIRNLLKGRTFDTVVDWIAFTPDQVERDIGYFRDITKQYIFISSASAYQTPPQSLPVTESTPLFNPVWEYSQNKIACESRLMKSFSETGFPVTIVRPSHTYDERTLPFHYRYTVIDRMRRGSKIIVHGDGTSLWTLTHHRDFAKGFTGLIGNPQAIGEAFHITSDEHLTWNQIYGIMAEAAGGRFEPVHIPSDLLAAWDDEYGPNLLGDKSHSMIFDNRKIKRLVPGFQCTIPFYQGAREIMAWYDSHPEAGIADSGVNRLMDTIIEKFQSAWPETGS